MSPALQPAPLSRKYPECTSWVVPPLDFTKLSYAKQTVIEPSTKDGETGTLNLLLNIQSKSLSHCLNRMSRSYSKWYIFLFWTWMAFIYKFVQAWSELMDISHPMARKNIPRLFESGYQGACSTAHPSFTSGFKKSSYSPGVRPRLHPADEDSGSKPCLGYRPLLSLNPLKFGPDYVWMSYEDVDCRRRDVGSALMWFFSQLQNKPKGRDIEVVGEAKDERGLVIDAVCLWSGNTVGMTFSVL